MFACTMANVKPITKSPGRRLNWPDECPRSRRDDTAISLFRPDQHNKLDQEKEDNGEDAGEIKQRKTVDAIAS